MTLVKLSANLPQYLGPVLVMAFTNVRIAATLWTKRPT